MDQKQELRKRMKEKERPDFSAGEAAEERKNL